MGQQPSSGRDRDRDRDRRSGKRRSSRDKRDRRESQQATHTVAVGPSVAVAGAPFGSVAMPGARNVAVGTSIAVPGSLGIPGGQTFAVMPGYPLGSSVAQIVQAPDLSQSALGFGSSQASAGGPPAAELLVPGVDFSPEALAATLPPLLPGLAAKSNLPGLNTTVASLPAGFIGQPPATQFGLPGLSLAVPSNLPTIQNLQVLQPSPTMPAEQMRFAAAPLMMTMVPTANYVTPTANVVAQNPFATAMPAPPVAGTPIPGTGLGSLRGALPTQDMLGARAQPTPLPTMQGMPLAPMMPASYAPPVGVPSARPSFVPPLQPPAPAPMSGVLSYPSVLAPGSPSSISRPSYVGALSSDQGWRPPASSMSLGQPASSISLGQDSTVQERHISREELMAAGNLMTDRSLNSSSRMGAPRPGSLSTPPRMFEERSGLGLEPIRASDAELIGYGRTGVIEELQRGPISDYGASGSVTLSASAFDSARSSGYPPSHPLAPRWVPPS